MFFVCFFVIGKEKKSSKFIQQRVGTQESLYFFGLEVPGAFYSPSTLYETTALVRPPPSKGLGSG